MGRTCLAETEKNNLCMQWFICERAPKSEKTLFLSRCYADCYVFIQVKSVMGPTIAIHNSGYGSSESPIGLPYQPDDPHTFVILNKNLIEFLDVTAEESHESLYQAVNVVFLSAL